MENQINLNYGVPRHSKSMSELPLQSLCFQYHWNTFPDKRQTLFHVNGKAKNAIEGSHFKAIGVVKGISDLVLLLPNKIIFIELKSDSGKQRPEQITFQKQCEALGHEYIIIRSFMEFKALINRVYNIT